MKQCTACKLQLEFDQFGKNNKSKDGLNYVCRSCKKIQDREYGRKNKEAINLRRKKHRDNNRESIAEAKKRSYEKNKQHYINKAKNYYDNNKDKCIEQSRERYSNMKDMILLIDKIDRQENPAKYLYKNAKSRAKKQGIPFDIQIQDINVPDVCPILGIELKVNEKTVNKHSPSLDKIIPELGYVKGNIQVISHLANTMKNAATIEEMLLFSKWIQLEFGDQLIIKEKE